MLLVEMEDIHSQAHVVEEGVIGDELLEMAIVVVHEMFGAMAVGIDLLHELLDASG